jgi:UDP-N-acetylglucosamine:LPS N-acetylglucosamine transferase
VAKPALLIPFPAATDNHQWWNALSLRDEKRFTVEVFDPKDTDGKLLDQLNVFLRNSLQGLYHTSHSVPQVVDSGEALLSEIFQYVGITQKT